MQVTTTANGQNRYVCLQHEGADLNVNVHPGETPAVALQRHAADCRRTAARLLKRAETYEAGADLLALPVSAS